MPALSDRVIKRWTSIAAYLLGASVPLVSLGKAVLAVLIFFPAVLALVSAGRCMSVTFNWCNFFRKPFVLGVIVVCLLWFISSVLSIDPIKSLTTWSRTLAIFILGAVLTHYFANKSEQLKIAQKSLIASSFLIFLLASYSLYIDTSLFELYALLKSGRADLIQSLKPFSSVTVCLIPVLVWSGWRLGGRWYALAILVIPLAGLTIYGRGIQPSTSALAGLGGAAIFVIVAAVFIRLSRRSAWLCGIVLILISIYSALYLIVNLPPPPFDENASLQLPFPDPHRQVIWGFTIDVIKAFPIIGVGPNTVNLVPGADIVIPYFNQEYLPAHPHNWVLEIAAETGISGLFGLLVTMGIGFKNLIIRSTRNPGAAWAAIALLAVFFISSLGNFSIWSSWWLSTLSILLIFPLADLNSSLKTANAHR